MQKRERLVLLIILFSVFVGVFLFIFLPKNYMNNSETNPIDSNAIDNYNQIETLPNPAAFYCTEMGGSLRIEKNEEGEYGICVFPDKTECGEWEFYAGVCGEKWSYCETKGYDLVVKDDGMDSYSPIYAACVDKVTKEEVGSISKILEISKKNSLSNKELDLTPKL